MKTTIEVENVKCHGCANSIKKGLKKIEGVLNTNVFVEKSTVEVEYNENKTDFQTIQKKLKAMGYPEKGKNSGLLSAKSFVSCAIGRISD